MPAALEAVHVNVCRRMQTHRDAVNPTICIVHGSSDETEHNVRKHERTLRQKEACI